MKPASPTAGGKYRLIAELGRGGMGSVYLAVASGPAGFNKLQVVKRLRPELAGSPEAVTLFLDEARVAARLNHQNVVQTNEVAFDGDFYFMAMEYLEGQSLDQIQRRASVKEAPMPLGVHLRILCDALAGLQYAHELTDFDGKPLNVVHRDVSPQNIFVTYEGQTKLVDFGIAKAATSLHQTESGVFRGKSAYAAPEQTLGHKVDRRADIFSMGAVLWQAAAGQPLWKGESEAKIMSRLASGDIPSPRSQRADVPERLEAICMRALTVDPAGRYATAAEMLAELESFLEARGEAVTTRAVGRFVSTLFADDRAAIRSVIEAQLGKTEPIDADRLPSLGAIALVPSPRRARATEKIVVQGLPPKPRAERTPRAVKPTGGRWSRVATGGAMGLAAIVLLATWRFAPLASPEDGHALAAASDAKTSPPPPAEAPSSEVRFVAVPADARILLDDQPLGANPFTGKMARDGLFHRVRAEAPHFLPKAQLIVFDEAKMEIKLTLDIDPAHPPEAPTSPP